MTPDREASRQPCDRVLIVDDNADMLETMRDVLELGGSTVATAPSAEEADRILAAGFDPSVVVLDVRLGGGESGEDWARRIRAAHPSLPIVIMSGDVRELRRLRDDVDAALSKPFQPDRLLEILSELCGEPA